jgi:hypothetical protein
MKQLATAATCFDSIFHPPTSSGLSESIYANFSPGVTGNLLNSIDAYQGTHRLCFDEGYFPCAASPGLR